jgi:AcrR family transcriptional regulator
MNATARLTADERRDEVIAAASIEFAETGYAGTSTAAIAQRAGVSQPYLFQLFRTKKELFIAAVGDCFDRTAETFVRSARQALASGMDPAATLERMGQAYIRLLLADPSVLKLQLQAYAACGDPEIQTFVRAHYASIWKSVAETTGAGPELIHRWFADGMLINVVASIGSISPDDLDPSCGKATFEGFLQSLIGGESAGS